MLNIDSHCSVMLHCILRMVMMLYMPRCDHLHKLLKEEYCNYYFLLLCLCHLTVSAEALCFSCPPTAFVCSFIQTDFVTAVSHERLEQS